MPLDHKQKLYHAFEYNTTRNLFRKKKKDEKWIGIKDKNKIIALYILRLWHLHYNLNINAYYVTLCLQNLDNTFLMVYFIKCLKCSTL